ncbi:MAG: S1 RNA-binding domain-containing protein [Oscillospiraceae bacterium]
MQLEVGKIYEGKVTGITKFGAFVELEKGTTGMVHISEVANTFVSEIKDHLTEGQQVKVKVLALGEDGKKISLSIKKAQPAPEKKPFNKGEKGNFRKDGQKRDRDESRDRSGKGSNQQGGQRRAKSFDKPSQDFAKNQDFMKNPPPVYDVRTTSDDADFEDMLSKFKASSEERFSDLKHVMENKRRNPSRRRG